MTVFGGGWRTSPNYSRLVISTSLISNNRLSRSEIVVPVFIHGNLRTGNKILWKRGEIAPQEQFLLFFHNIFNMFLSSRVKLHIHLLNVFVRFIVFLTSATLIYFEVRIFRNVSESPLEFEMTRVDGILIFFFFFFFGKMRKSIELDQTTSSL